MNNIKTAFSVISAVVALSVVTFSIYFVWNKTQKILLQECVNSIPGNIAEDSREIATFARSGESWYVLTDGEVKTIFSDKNIQFGKCGFVKSIPQDYLENNPKLAVRKFGEYGFEVMAWSRGFDNISGTDDDIVSSNGEEIPK